MTGGIPMIRWRELGWLAPVCALVAIAWGVLGADERATTKGDDRLTADHFDRVIAPLLARRCLSCHNSSELKGKLDLTSRAAAMRGGESGAVIAAGKPDDSLIWQYVDGDEMPPKKPLAAAEKETLRKWIADGAHWGAETIDRFAITTEVRAGYDWWSLQPIRRAAIPQAFEATATRSPIDSFVAAKRDAAGLMGSSLAAPATLVRRLTFDLLGLPPTPEEVAAFMADQSPDAYERLADRLLASPHFGERWGRHWLDVVRFGESDGYEYDKLRENAWPYRDWVIRAINADLPYDEFARLQLAGDVLQPGDRQGIVATGFLVAGAHDSLVPAGDVMKAIMRQDELEDVVGVISQTFLGLTVHCARCHDHKFDPIRQTDYYRLAAAISGYAHGERELPPPPGEVAAIDVLMDAARRKICELEEPVRREILAERKAKGDGADTVDLKPIAAWDFGESLNDRAGSMHVTLMDGAARKDGAIRVDGNLSYAVSKPLGKDLREKTLAAWVTLDNLTQQGGGVISLQMTDGGVFDAIVFGEREAGRWMAGSNGFVRTQPFYGPAEDDAAKRPTHVAIVYSADGTIAAYRNGAPYGKPYQAGDVATFPAGKAQVVFGLRHNPPGGNRMLAGAIHRAALYDRALTPAEVAAAAGAKSDYVATEEILARLSPDRRELHQDLRRELTALDARRARLRTTKLYTCVPQTAGVSHVLVRGNPQQKADVVAAGGVTAVRGVEANFGLPPDAAEAQRRAKLAAWISNRNNPLFARVMANRLWYHHFGAGLVDTPNDFGYGGARPTHPELLDYLATELVSGGFALKSLHRAIVTSATYRQASSPRADAARIDADNRLLWRRNPQRLEAETVRDAMLVAAGELNTSMGGPGFFDFRAFVHRSTQFYEPLDVTGADVQRRTVYRTWARGGRNPFLDTLDCADPSTTTPKRSVTTTPLQALAMWNNAFAMRMAETLAARVRRLSGDDVARQATLAYQLAVSRSPAANERDAAAKFIPKYGLAAFCRVLLNSNEFMYVD